VRGALEEDEAVEEEELEEEELEAEAGAEAAAVRRGVPALRPRDCPHESAVLAVSTITTAIPGRMFIVPPYNFSCSIDENAASSVAIFVTP
jgi:hypothetical protein